MPIPIASSSAASLLRPCRCFPGAPTAVAPIAVTPPRAPCVALSLGALVCGRLPAGREDTTRRASDAAAPGRATPSAHHRQQQPSSASSRSGSERTAAAAAAS